MSHNLPIVRRNLILALGLTFLLCTAQANDTVSDARLKLATKHYVQQYVDAEQVQAVSIGVVRAGRRWTMHLGSLSQENRTKPNDGTLYEIGSLTKLMTSVLLAEAVIRHRTLLHNAIDSLAPELSTNPLLAKSIRLVDLATHRSGLPRMPGNFRPADQLNPYVDYSRDKLFDNLKTHRLEKSAVGSYRYSNLGVGLLGELLATDAKTDFENLFKRVIARPLGMTRSGVRLSAEDQKRLAPAHNEGLERTKSWQINGLTGAGGIRSTAHDMTRFLQATLRPPASPLGRAINMTWRQQTPVGDGNPMGLGWFIKPSGLRFHGGRTGGYRASIRLDRKSQTGVIVLTNSATNEAVHIAKAVLRLARGKPIPRIKAAYKIAISDQIKQRLIGKYRFGKNKVFEVRLNRGWLVGQISNQRSRRLYPTSATEWEATRVKARLSFDLPATGPARSVTLSQRGNTLLAARLNR